MRSRLLVVVVVLIAFLAFVGYLFVVQNSARATQLSLDLGFAAWQLSNPVSVPALLGIAFGAGALITLGFTLPRLSRLGRRTRALERQIALLGGEQDDAPWR